MTGASQTALATRLRAEGAAIGEVFAFMSALYFRGKLAYAGTFGHGPEGWDAAQVIVPGRGLLAASTVVWIDDLRAMAGVAVDLDEPRYVMPLIRDATRLAAHLGPGDQVVLLGSLATPKYLTPLREVFGRRLHYPEAFTGMGDMKRGSVMLNAVAAGRELTYVPAA